MEVKRSYRYRLYPNNEAKQKMFNVLESCRQTYNELLVINQETYENTGKGLSKFDMNKTIPYINCYSDSVHSQTYQNVSDRLSKAYANFFRRVKERKKGKKIKVGYPRFKKQIKSFAYPQSGFKLKGKKLYLSKIGWIGIKIGKTQNRIQGTVKTLTVKHMPSGKWFAIFSCIYNTKIPKVINKKSIGIDMGLEHLANLSDDSKIDNPRYLIRSERRLSKLQRRLSRKHGKNNRNISKHQVALLHEHIANQRHDFLHKISRQLVNQFGTIVIEDLDIKNMVRHPYLAKHINDASWGQLSRMIDYKASSAGGLSKKVNPRGTSQKCSQCGNKVPKTLAQRWHICPYCGIKLHRDTNAAINIHTEGTSEIYACRDGSSVLNHAGFEHSLSRKQEATQLVGW